MTADSSDSQRTVPSCAVSTPPLMSSKRAALRASCPNICTIAMPWTCSCSSAFICEIRVLSAS
ncbi:MAG: hypothetical protein O3B85_02670 [Planctomycetota bacterium]|nr:hypothetical protein [Planctomycetota bacterium]